MISTYILPNIDAISKLEVSELVTESPHERMKGFIELAWAFSTILGKTHLLNKQPFYSAFPPRFVPVPRGNRHPVLGQVLGSHLRGNGRDHRRHPSPSPVRGFRDTFLPFLGEAQVRTNEHGPRAAGDDA